MVWSESEASGTLNISKCKIQPGCLLYSMWLFKCLYSCSATEIYSLKSKILELNFKI